LGENFTLSNTTQYFIIGGENAVLNGNYYTVTVTAANYPGLVRNGSASAGHNNCTVEKIKVNAGGAGSLNAAGGWVGQQYFSRGCTSTISECSSNGHVQQHESGGIVGKNAACVNGNLTINKCFTTGSVNQGSSKKGLITGSLAANVGGTVTISNCFTTGAVDSADSGGIFGKDAGNGANPGTLNLYNCFTSGPIATTARAIGFDILGNLNIHNCYFLVSGEDKLYYDGGGALITPAYVLHTLNWNRDKALESVGSFGETHPNNNTGSTITNGNVGANTPWDTKTGDTEWTLLWAVAAAGSGAVAEEEEVVAPSDLSYAASPFTLTKGTPMQSASATVTGTVTSWSISPSLPTGLSLNTSTGAITGTPTEVKAQTDYTITATNNGGSTTGTIKITVNDVAPSNLSYAASPFTLTKGTAMTSASPSISGGTVVSWSISAPLPSNLSFNTSTGVISGTPNVISPQANYTITATNTGGSTTTTVTITVSEASTGGDPYVTTLKGLTYKLDNISGVCRMLQGSIEGTPLVINAEMKKDSYKTEEEMNKWALEYDAHRRKISNQSFYTRIFAKFGADSIAVIDLEKGEISNSIGSKIEITRCNSKEVGSSLEMYSYETECRAAYDLRLGKVTLRVKWFSNRQLRNELSISGGEFVKNADGFLIRPMCTKQCRVKKIGTDKMIKMGDSIFKKSVLETFYSIQKDGTRRSKSLNIKCV
jgi:hypothetical protein